MSPSFVCFLYDRNVELETPTEAGQRMDGWRSGWMDGLRDEWVSGWVDGRVGGWMG